MIYLFELEKAIESEDEVEIAILTDKVILFFKVNVFSIELQITNSSPEKSKKYIKVYDYIIFATLNFMFSKCDEIKRRSVEAYVDHNILEMVDMNENSFEESESRLKRSSCISKTSGYTMTLLKDSVFQIFNFLMSMVEYMDQNVKKFSLALDMKKKKVITNSNILIFDMLIEKLPIFGKKNYDSWKKIKGSKESRKVYMKKLKEMV